MVSDIDRMITSIQTFDCILSNFNSKLSNFSIFQTAQLHLNFIKLFSSSQCLNQIINKLTHDNFY